VSRVVVREHARRLATASLLIAALAGCVSRSSNGGWPLPGADLAGTRTDPHAKIDAENVSRLRVRWRFRFAAAPSFSGIFASTPVVDERTVYVQDLRSNVFALDRDTGVIRWEHRFRARNDGPNGLALDGGRVYGATDTTAFALAAANGTRLWQTRLVSRSEQFVDIAPVAWHGFVFVSTVGYAPFGRGAIYGLDAGTGAVRWKFVTVRDPWPHPFEAGGGGLWYPVSIDSDGRLYGGSANPSPWGGSRRRPNGAAFPGRVLYTDSLLVLDARSGRLDWFDQVTPHDVRDYDFEATPILAAPGGRELVLGAGKAGVVIAWDRHTHNRVWTARVGLHRNDSGPLPRRRVRVCPGLLGGVETPMAYAAGRLFVPVVDLCGWGSATSRQPIETVRPDQGGGRLVALDAATGRVLWQHRFLSPDFGCAAVARDVVFTSTYDGTVYGLASDTGRVLWHARLPAGINACPAVAGDMVLIGAGVGGRGEDRRQLVAFGLP
jgi:alcohol dehydrogenase (cytochrome c)